MKLNIGNPLFSDKSNIMDIEVPEQLKLNISTGWSEIDQLFSGDGIMPSTVAMITGTAGAGKSSLIIQLADQITGYGIKHQDDKTKGGVVLYNGLEESFYQVKRVIDRIELKNGFIPSYESEVNALIEKANKVRDLPENKDKQFFLFVDSLACLEVKRDDHKRGRDKGKDAQMIEAAQMLTNWAKETFSIVFLIGHVNKKNEFAGRQTLKHIIDCHLHLDIDTDRRSINYGDRIATMEKNRTGVAGLCYNFEVGRKGFIFKRDA